MHIDSAGNGCWLSSEIENRCIVALICDSEKERLQVVTVEVRTAHDSIEAVVVENTVTLVPTRRDDMDWPVESAVEHVDDIQTADSVTDVCDDE
jgi:hypothetical protein